MKSMRNDRRNYCVEFVSHATAMEQFLCVSIKKKTIPNEVKWRVNTFMFLLLLFSL